MQPASSWKGRVAACWSKLVHTLCARVRTTLFHGAEKDRLHAELRCVMAMLRCVLMQAWASGRARPKPKECRIARVGAELKTGVCVSVFVWCGSVPGPCAFRRSGSWRGGNGGRERDRRAGRSGEAYTSGREGKNKTGRWRGWRAGAACAASPVGGRPVAYHMSSQLQGGGDRHETLGWGSGSREKGAGVAVGRWHARPCGAATHGWGGV